MSKRELGRVEVLARVRSKQLRVLDAGRLLRVSYRQAKRLWKRYREEGAAGLKHRSAGGSSNRAHDEKFRQQVLRRVREKYGGAGGERFGPTLAAEHLASEDGLQVHAETLRRWMLTEGLWSRERKRRRHLLRRERKEHFGEMVQMDGSFHAWLEERGPQGCLIDLVDDATSTTWARLGEQETIWAVVDALRAWIERYGVPQSVYVDWKNVYKRAATVKEQLRGEEPVTQFGRMCAKLGIAVIAASSPQGKGRVERQHGTHQDRLVKKLRRKGITSHEAANVYLERDYLPEHNRRVARAAAKAGRNHRQRVSWAHAAVAGNSGTRETARGRGQAYRGTGQPTETTAGAAEVGAPEQPPVARGRSPRRAATRQEASSDRGAGVVGLALRFALTAPPFGLRRATLRARPTTKKRRKTKSKKGTLLTK